MPTFGLVKRQDLIGCLRQLGFEGSYAGGRHQYLLKAEIKLALPNPHQGDISSDLLSRILRQGGISKEEWEKL